MWGPVIKNPDEFATIAEHDFRHPHSKFVHVPVDVKEGIEGYDFFLDLPGVKKSDLSLKLLGKNVLSVEGKRQRIPLEGADGVWHREERPMGSFCRKFRLPDKADLDVINASFQDGVLTIHVAKHTPGPHDEHAHATTIPIN